MKLDIPKNLLRASHALFSQYPGIQTVRLFGSRAEGRSQPRSDYDLAAEGPLPPEEMSRLRLALENLPTLCPFALIHLAGVPNAALHTRILQEGIPIFQKKTNRQDKLD